MGRANCYCFAGAGGWQDGGGRTSVCRLSIGSNHVSVSANYLAFVELEFGAGSNLVAVDGARAAKADRVEQAATATLNKSTRHLPACVAGVEFGSRRLAGQSVRSSPATMTTKTCHSKYASFC
jgi:hypothetical protein